MLQIAPEDPASTVARQLRDELAVELRERHPERFAHQAEPIALEPPAGPDAVFLVAWFGGDPVGCGGLHPTGPDGAEIRCFYVIPQRRARGIGTEILHELERCARDRGWTRLEVTLDTREPECLGLCRRRGFLPAGPAPATTLEPTIPRRLEKRLPPEPPHAHVA